MYDLYIQTFRTNTPQQFQTHLQQSALATTLAQRGQETSDMLQHTVPIIRFF
jgi:hypothetical protein